MNFLGHFFKFILMECNKDCLMDAGRCIGLLQMDIFHHVCYWMYSSSACDQILKYIVLHEWNCLAGCSHSHGGHHLCWGLCRKTWGMGGHAAFPCPTPAASQQRLPHLPLPQKLLEIWGAGEVHPPRHSLSVFFFSLTCAETLVETPLWVNVWNTLGCQLLRYLHILSTWFFQI